MEKVIAVEFKNENEAEMESESLSQADAAQVLTYTPDIINIIDRLNAQQTALNKYFKERKEIVKSMYMCFLAKQHLFLLGPPGIAKSALIDAFGSGFADFKVFKWLLTKFSTPDELFGTYSIPELKNGKLSRITNKKLQEAEFAFLDEIFRGNGSILNSLLTAMNERFIEDVENIPLESLFGGANSIPEDNDLNAFFDRFSCRHKVNPISDGRNFEAMLKLSDKFVMPAALIVKKNEVNQLRALMNSLDVSEIVHKMKQIWVDLKKEQIYPSDRRYKWAIQLCRASAVLNKRPKVIADDLEILSAVLWSEVKDIPIVENIVQKYMNPIMKQVKDIVAQAEEQRDKLRAIKMETAGAIPQITEGMSKLKVLTATLKDLSLKCDSDIKGKIVDKINEIMAMGREIQDEKLSFLKSFE